MVRFGHREMLKGMRQLTVLRTKQCRGRYVRILDRRCFVHPASAEACPIAYRYRASDMAVGADGTAETVLVVGGLYGNLAALKSIEDMAEAESLRGGAVTVVFNGDFNFFNAHATDFREINSRILHRNSRRSSTRASLSSPLADAPAPGRIDFVATAGNIELAIAGGAAGGAGCGCDYPAYVSRDVVQRSDHIVEQLGSVACGSSRAAGADTEMTEILRTLANLPLFMTLKVGAKRVAVIHGDPQMLSGWAFSVESMAPPDVSVNYE
jgi:hypothetical protein